ncbi:hypothetical protein BT63DRAFT_451932 [Microthyrium microscopicum]|uniref:RlpA-like protein double-psi beta-barrel domain-containing protein n=1 Tax=Microthyrium microscopicum TaxID=703497 RepID=A0A6A6UR50_9PEZI|nr:hypothetical protein BT63DRAFT_451932 [Microthyrium microscopicum]
MKFIAPILCALAGLVIAAPQPTTTNTARDAQNGQLTYFATGLGACGVTNQETDSIVAIDHQTFDSGNVDGNPNHNRNCGRVIRITQANYKTVSKDVTVVDRCEACQPGDLDVTRTIFGGLAPVESGRVQLSWHWLT